MTTKHRSEILKEILNECGIDPDTLALSLKECIDTEKGVFEVSESLMTSLERSEKWTRILELQVLYCTLL